MSPSRWDIVGSKQTVFTVHVLEARQMTKHKDLSSFAKACEN